MKVTILGCGSSSGVPSVENKFGNCDPSNKKNRRTRSSILINIDGFNILIDTSPDLRYQALKNNISNIDAILYTHYHTDHIVGAFELRGFNRLMEASINCYLNRETYDNIMEYCKFPFVQISDSNTKGFSRPSLNCNIINNDSTFHLNNNRIKVDAILHKHGKCNVLGYIFNNKLAYVTDFSDFYPKNLSKYKNLDCLIISACTPFNNSAHTRYDNVIHLINNKLRPKTSFLTHLNEFIDYDTEMSKLGKNSSIKLCYDGLVIDFI